MYICVCLSLYLSLSQLQANICVSHTCSFSINQSIYLCSCPCICLGSCLPLWLHVIAVLSLSLSLSLSLALNIFYPLLPHPLLLYCLFCVLPRFFFFSLTLSLYIYAAGCLIEPPFSTLFSRNLRKRSAKMSFCHPKPCREKCAPRGFN